jgi:hypothetical protein
MVAESLLSTSKGVRQLLSAQPHTTIPIGTVT